MKSKFLIAVFVIFALASLFSLYDYYSEDFSSFESAVDKSTENYFESDLGKTRYKVYGAEGDPTVIMVHGFNGFIESWEPNIAPIVNSGYRVVVYDQWGRGLSARPRIDLNLQALRNQLDMLVNHLGIDKFHLIGSSLGCVIASDYAINNPRKVEKIALIGPAGWSSEGSSQSSLTDIPVLGEVVFHYFGQKIIQPKVEEYFYNKTAHFDVIGQWQRFANYPGFTRSALSMLRHAPLYGYNEGWSELGKLGKPTLFVWGELDMSFPFSNAEKAKAFIPHSKIVGIKKAAHWVNIEKPAVVNEAIISFLNE